MIEDLNYIIHYCMSNITFYDETVIMDIRWYSTEPTNRKHFIWFPSQSLLDGLSSNLQYHYNMMLYDQYFQETKKIY
jgi:hypothetical protein